MAAAIFKHTITVCKAALLALGFTWVMLGTAWGHGPDHQWIMDQTIRDPISGELCCGVQDCGFIQEPKPVEGGYLIHETGEVIPYVRLVPKSPDGRWRRCQWLYGENLGKTRCLIGIPPGS